MQTITRIKGATTKTVIDGRMVEVVFRSPYRWRIYEGQTDVTGEFGCQRTGYSLPPHSPEWIAFHDKVKAGEISQRIW